MAAISTSQDLIISGPVSRHSMMWYLHRACREPGHAVSVLLALLRGFWYKAYLPLCGVRFRAGSNLRVFGSLKVRGPGQVIFGDNIVVGAKATPWTHHKDATIIVGDNVMMGATRFGCVREIVIGRDCILAEASIMDSDFHSVHVNRRSESAPVRTAPVHIAENVWVSQGATILAGTRIGKNSVVSCGAVCMREFPENVVIMGNPAKPIAPVPGTSAVGSTPASSIARGV